MLLQKINSKLTVLFNEVNLLLLKALLTQCPVKATGHEGVPVHRVHWVYDLGEPARNTVHSLIEDWTAVATLYDAVLTFAEEYNGKAE